MKLIEATFHAYAAPGMDDIDNPDHLLAAAVRYAAARYGTIETHEQLEAVLEKGEHGWYYAHNYEGPWIIYSTEHGDCLALRPLNEDDPSDSAEKGVVGRLVDVEDITLPFTIVAGV